MGFLDKLFKPKWKDEDSKIRFNAVKELNDQKILIKIAKNDSDWNIRREVVQCKLFLTPFWLLKP